MNIGPCIELFHTDLDYVDRIRKVHALGFRTYEFWFHDKTFDGSAVIAKPKDTDAIAEINRELGMTAADFVLNHTEGAIVASLVDPSDRSRLLDGLGEILDVAAKLECTSVICTSGPTIEGVSLEKQLETMVETLKQLAKPCGKAGVTLLLEPFNTKVDHPGTFLDDPDVCLRVLEDVAEANVKMLFDIYHMQIMTGNIVSFIRNHCEKIGHFHIAGVPGRHEPAECELNYRFILQEAAAAGYEGAFGLEYFPTKAHDESLRETLAALTAD